MKHILVENHKFWVLDGPVFMQTRSQAGLIATASGAAVTDANFNKMIATVPVSLSLLNFF
jgi:hypothetical protein